MGADGGQAGVALTTLSGRRNSMAPVFSSPNDQRLGLGEKQAPGWLIPGGDQPRGGKVAIISNGLRQDI